MGGGKFYFSPQFFLYPHPDLELQQIRYSPTYTEYTDFFYIYVDTYKSILTSLPTFLPILPFIQPSQPTYVYLPINLTFPQTCIYLLILPFILPSLPAYTFIPILPSILPSLPTFFPRLPWILPFLTTYLPILQSMHPTFTPNLFSHPSYLSSFNLSSFISFNLYIFPALSFQVYIHPTSYLS